MDTLTTYQQPAVVLNEVDQLGIILAQIADLEKQADALKDKIKNTGEGSYEGALFKATVTLSQRATVDSKKIYEIYHVPSDVIQQYTKVSAVITCKVTSR